MNKYLYDKFQSRSQDGCFELPDSTPYTVTVMTEDGTLREIYVNRFDLDLRKVVALKVHKPSETDLLVQKYVAETDTSPKYARVLTEFHEWLQGRDEKVNGKPEPEKDWLERKLDILGYWSKHDRMCIRRWFENPDRYPDVPFNLENKILTVKTVPGGRVVVSPVGHTVAYSYVKEVWHYLCDQAYQPKPVRVSVREYCGRGRNMSPNRTVRLKIGRDNIEVGCQKIPMQALIDLAEREGWTGTIKKGL